MSNYTASALLAFQSKINQTFNAPELRELQNPILRQALSYQPLLLTDVKSIKESDKRSVYGYYMKRRTATNGTARSTAPTGTQGDSGQVALSWVTFSETFMAYKQTGADNIFPMVEQLENGIMQTQRILRERVGAYIVSQLHANRTQAVASGTRNATWNNTTYAFENDASQANLFFENAASVLRQNKYYEKLDVVADPKVFKLANFNRFQGAGNAQNLGYQFQQYNPDGIMEHSVLGSDVATDYAEGCAIVLPQGSFSITPWIPSINRRGEGDYESYNGGYGTIIDATGLPLSYAVRGWAQKADGSAAGSVVQDIQMNFELSVDIAFVASPLSTAGESAIFEFGQTS